ncbi:hypothetical protein D3C76_1585510 [compost metagenome]
MRRSKAQQFGDGLFVAAVLRWAFFQHQAELLPELLVGFRIVFGQLVQHLQHAFGQRATQVLGNTAVLQDFTRNVQWQIVGIDQAADKAQVVRHELLGVIHDKHALNV